MQTFLLSFFKTQISCYSCYFLKQLFVNLFRALRRHLRRLLLFANDDFMNLIEKALYRFQPPHERLQLHILQDIVKIKCFLTESALFRKRHDLEVSTPRG